MQVIKREDRPTVETYSFIVTRYRGKTVVSEVQGNIVANRQTGKLVINYSQGTAVSAEWEERK
jgi:hypothetical protein